MRTGRGAIFVATLAVGLGLSGHAYADACIAADNGVSYQLQFGTGNPLSGTPIVITGTRVISTIRTPVFGSLISNPTTGVMIALEEIFNFGSGLFTHPEGTTIMTFPPSPAVPKYDTTFHGNGAPHNVVGLIQIVACPLAATASGVDPNAKE
jgi:hypothetical protein